MHKSLTTTLLGYVTGVFLVFATGGLLFQLYAAYVFGHWKLETAQIVISLFWYLVTLSLPFLAGGFLGYRYGRRVERKKAN